MLSYNSVYQERLALIADYFAQYQLYLGEVTQSKLEDWVQQELGHCEGAWQNYPSVCHIISGNTNHAGLQSVLRALIVGGKHRVKLPSQGANEVEACLANLPLKLKEGLSWSRVWQQQWLDEADVVVAYGSDSTMKKITSQLTESQKIVSHGHKVGLAYVDMTASDTKIEIHEIAQNLVKDVVAFNQQGCLSLQVVYVNATDEMRQLLAQQVAIEFNGVKQSTVSEASLDEGELAHINYAREVFELKALVNLGKSQLWVSEFQDSVWTVAMDDTMIVDQLMGNCWLWIKPWNASINSESEFLEQTQLSQSHLSSLAIYPYHQKCINKFNYQSLDRICQIGQLQHPPLNWRPGNRATLLDLVIK